MEFNHHYNSIFFSAKKGCRSTDAKVRRNKQKKVRRINARRPVTARGRKVMNLQQGNVLLKESLGRTKGSVSKETTIFPSSVINNYREKYATVVAALKRKVPCFKENDITFNGKETGSDALD